MSIIRFGDGSDVYLICTYRQGARVAECCGCRLVPRDDRGMPTAAFPAFTTALGMCSHLDEHRKAGHEVPERAYDRTLERDAWLEGRDDDELGDVPSREPGSILREQDGPAEEEESAPLGGTRP